VGIPRSDVIQHLAELGVAQIDNFNQGSAERKQAEFDQGYCHGICLDWVRRVLQGGRPSFGFNEEKRNQDGYDFVAKRTRQGLRQGRAYKEHRGIRAKVKSAHLAGIARSNTLDDLYAAGLAVYKTHMGNGNSHMITGLDAQSATVGGMQVNLVTEANKLLPSGQGLKASMQVGALYDVLIRLSQMSDEVGDKADKLRPKTAQGQHAAQPTGPGDQAAWRLFSGAMQKEHPKKRSFEKIALIHIDPVKDYTSLANTIAAVTNPRIDNFEAGRAMIVGISFEGDGEGEEGHAVATHWRPDNRFTFLDPNYGMFEYAHLEGAKSVAAALLYLFGTVYPQEEAIRGVRNRVDYSIYGLVA
jgi:hypothetical protein